VCPTPVHVEDADQGARSPRSCRRRRGVRALPSPRPPWLECCRRFLPQGWRHQVRMPLGPFVGLVLLSTCERASQCPWWFGSRSRPRETREATSHKSRDPLRFELRSGEAGTSGTCAGRTCRIPRDSSRHGAHCLQRCAASRWAARTASRPARRAVARLARRTPSCFRTVSKHFQWQPSERLVARPTRCCRRTELVRVSILTLIVLSAGRTYQPGDAATDDLYGTLPFTDSSAPW